MIEILRMLSSSNPDKGFRALGVQLRTVKDIKLPSGRTRFFYNKLSSDSDSGSLETSKKPYPKFFPRGFRLAKIFGAKNLIVCTSFGHFMGGLFFLISNAPILILMPSLLLVRRSDAASAYKQPTPPLSLSTLGGKRS